MAHNINIGLYRILRVTLLTVFLLPTSGCDYLKTLDLSSPDEISSLIESDQLQIDADKALENKSFQKAITRYEELQARFPFGDHAAQTQLNLAYAQYKNGDFEAAIASADRFIKTYPTNASVDYAYYLKGLVNYNQGTGYIARFLPTDASQRDPVNSRESYAVFSELIRRFPNSAYAPDAKQRIIALRNKLASYEINIARYYLKRKAYIAAANRASAIIQNYQKTTAIPDALKIMQEAYEHLGVNDLAKDAERVYQKNYPNGPPPIYKDTGMIQTIWEFIGLEN
ncbi:MAG: outer membrane protein assembly factor BamD [Methylococcales bacterium]|jgi:outer membrane protein assembly factor BamD|nr:outer membrane protein assembly factor BamD [Methylococcaceae bacterium]HIL40576.1 outer membrane protein assembly factor BamD [Methylococcales bacterium]